MDYPDDGEYELTDANGMICQIKTSDGSKELSNMKTENHGSLELSLETPNANPNWFLYTKKGDLTERQISSKSDSLHGKQLRAIFSHFG